MRKQTIVIATFTSVLVLGCNNLHNNEHKAKRLVENLQHLSKDESAVSINKQLIALGETAVPHVIPLLSSSEASYRVNAAWILGEIGSQNALPALSHQLRIETDDTSREFQIQAVCSILKIPNNITATEALKKIEEVQR